MTMPRTIFLTVPEMLMAERIGKHRNDESIKDGRRESYGATGNNEEYHVHGCYGEIAVAKFLNVFWTGATNVFNVPDVGGFYVRCGRPGKDLWIRPSDGPEPRCFVTGAENAFTIQGWTYPHECKKEEWYCDPQGRNAPVWMVPTSHLHPVNHIWDLDIRRLRDIPQHDNAI